MKVKISSFFLLLSLGFLAFSPPSSAISTLKNVLTEQSLEKLEEYVCTLEVKHIDEIRYAVEWIDWKNDDSVYWSTARAMLLKRLRELAQEEEHSSLPLPREEPSQEPARARYSGGDGGGGGGQDDGDGGPFFVGHGSSASSVFAPRASPWNSPQGFMREWGLSDKLSEMLGPTELELRAPRASVPDMAKIISFNPIHFLAEAKQKLQHSRLKAEITSFLANKNRDHSQTIDLCWRALVKLKTEILSVNLEDLPYVYMTMAKLLLATQMPPSFEISRDVRIHDPSTPQETYNRLNSYLRARIAEFNIVKREEKKDVIYKWSLLYHALLNMESVKKNPGREDNERRIADANNFLHEAGRLRTTKSVHVFLAHLYFEHGHLLGFDNREIDTLVGTELDSFYSVKQPEAEKSSKARAEREVASFWSVVSQPPYFRDRAVQEDVRQLLESIMAIHDDQHQEPPIPVVVTQMDLEAAATLPVRNIDIRYLLERRETYSIQGRRFVNYNVSGEDFRCFFNSIGIDAADQVRLLLQNHHDQRVRAITANEIVSAWRHFYQLPQPVRAALNARDLLERQARVDRLVAGESQQDLRAELQTEQEAILTELRSRASSLPVFQAFVQHQIGTRIDDEEDAPYPMMVMQQDVVGEEENELSNLAAIDAIALVNGIGLRIFQVVGAELRPVHTFIPDEATGVAYLIYSAEAQHFTTLIPAEGVMDEGEGEGEEDHEQLDILIQAAYEAAIDQGRLTKHLSRLLRERFPKIENTSTQTDDEVRLILFLRFQGWEHKQIAGHPLVHLSKSRVGDVLAKNGMGRHLAFDNETIDRIFNAYLSSGYGIKGRGYAFSEIATPIAQALGLDRRVLLTFFENISSHRILVLKKRGALTADERSEIVNLYRDNPSFSEIAGKTRLPLLLILEVLNEDLPQDARPRILDPSQIVRSEPTEERNKKIVEGFHHLRKAQGKAPSASDVVRHTGYTLKVVLKALKKEGLIVGTTKARHLSQELIEKIRAQWVAREWDAARSKEQRQKDLAEEFGVSFIQIKELIAGRSYHKDTGTKRKRHVTAHEIQAAYKDLSPEEQPNALAVLGRLLNCAQQQVEEALEALGVYLGTQHGGSKKQRKE